MCQKYKSIIKFEKMDKQPKKITFTGDVPLPRFGHSITYYTQDHDKLCLYGGAIGGSNSIVMADSVYSLDMNKLEWKKIQCTGIVPSGRAAHGAACFEPNKIVIYGGATQQGLASDQLYILDIKGGVGIWNIANIKHRTPGKRYAHSLVYSQPNLIVFGGNFQNKVMNDLWVLNIQKKPLTWCEVKCKGNIPKPRDYHSTSLCTSGISTGMIIVFGGRAENKDALNDCWGLVKHNSTGEWDWVKSPTTTTSPGRYQHSALFLDNLMIISGGKTNNTGQTLPLEVFDLNTNKWSTFENIPRFRHVSWLFNRKLYVLGGLRSDGRQIKVDPDEVDLQKLFKDHKELLGVFDKLNQSKLSQKSLSPSSTKLKSQSPQNSRTIQTISPILKKERMKIQFERQQRIIQERQSQTLLKEKKKTVILEPVYAKQGKTQTPLTQELKNKQSVAHYFLNQLMHPQKLAKFEDFSMKFEASKVIQLCDLAEEIIASQPMLLNVKAPAKIFGDIHGQLSDLMSFFQLYGTPHQKGATKDIQNFDYIFLGDYVDRGNHSLQVICLLLALKVVYPKQIHLLRGNHEDAQVNCDFGFMEQCQRKLQEESSEPNSVYCRINQLFQWLPLGAVAEEKILCIHGGIGKGLNYVEEINEIKRPLQIQHVAEDHQSQLVLDILWSDPTQSDNQIGIHPNFPRDPRGIGDIVRFGPDRVQSFLKTNNLNMIVRAHECVMDGIERFAGGSLITVFSATDYCRRHKNAGAILILKTNLQMVPKAIYPKKYNANTWLEDDQNSSRRPATPPRWRSSH